MKKLIILIIAVLYMGAATGATVHLHYCMNELVSLRFFKKEQGKCSKCGMKESKDNCCKEEQKLLKLDAGHKASETAFHLFKLAPAVIYYISDFPFTERSSITEEYPLSHAPPRCRKINSYILNRNFRI